jgi:cytochrome c oxidase subunit 1
MVFSVFGIGFLSFIVWAHHMYLTGMGRAVSSFFQFTTVSISVPSVIILSDLFLSLRRGSIRFPVPMLFATAFMPMFGIGGLTGIPLALAPADLYLHDTYYLIAHFHYLVAPGTIFALFAATYYWFPKATGRMMNEFWGKIHFWPTLILMNVIFFPMFLQGMLGMHRRWYDGGQGHSVAGEKAWGLSGFGWNVPISTAAWLMGLAQIPFILNFLWSLKHGRKVTSDNPWDATTLEWATPTPPPHGNFTEPINVYRGPYDYSVRGAERDFCPQTEAVAAV